MLNGDQFEKFSQKTLFFIEQSDNYGQKILKTRKTAFEQGNYMEALYWKPSQYTEVAKHFKRKLVTTDLLKDFYSYTLILNEVVHQIVMATLSRGEITPAMTNTVNLSLSNTIFVNKYKSVRNSVENKNISDADRKELSLLKKATAR